MKADAMKARLRDLLPDQPNEVRDEIEQQLEFGRRYGAAAYANPMDMTITVGGLSKAWGWGVTGHYANGTFQTVDLCPIRIEDASDVLAFGSAVALPRGGTP